MKKNKKTAVFAYMPAIHKGYINFFRKYKGDILILDGDVIKDFVHIGRDLRLLLPSDNVRILASIFPGRKIVKVNKALLKKWPYDFVVMPNDEIMIEIAEKYFSEKKHKYVNTFLRWNKVITSKENEVRPDRKITKDKLDRELMEQATKESEKSSDWWRQIGSLVLKDGKVIIKSHNRHLPSDHHLSLNGDPRSNWNAGERLDIYTSIHSEASAIAEAAKKGISLDGADIYVTTFPCPNCARQIALSGIKKVYYKKGYSVLDAEEILRHFGIEIILVKD